jgi:moderate conductance mechanosensitive channel
MQSGVSRFLSFVVIACVWGAATALGASETSSASSPHGMFDALQRDMLVLKSRLGLMLSALPNLPEIGPFLVQRLTKQHDPEHIWVLGLQLAAIIGGGSFGEVVARRMFRPILRFLPAINLRTEFGRLGALLLTALIRVFELGAFLLVGIGLFFTIYDGHQAARYAFWYVLSIVILVRLVSVGLRVLLAPGLPELRLPELDNRSARGLFRSLVSVAALVISAGLISTLLLNIGLEEPLHLAVSGVLILAATSGLIAVIWGERRAITQLITGRSADHAQRNDLGGLFAANWHVFATCIVVAIAIAAFCERLVTGERQINQVYGTLGLLLGLLLIDGLLRMAVRSYFGVVRLAEAGAPQDAAPMGEDDNTNAAYGPLILRNCRLALSLLAVVLIGRLWGFDAAAFGSTGLGARVAEAVFQIVITLLLASAAWSVVKISINRHLPHEKRHALELATDEGSGSGLSRRETLLPLVRMFLFVTILSMA